MLAKSTECGCWEGEILGYQCVGLDVVEGIRRAELASSLGSLAGAVEVRKARLVFRTFGVVTQRQAERRL